jgi:hypothetical protein
LVVTDVTEKELKASRPTTKRDAPNSSKSANATGTIGAPMSLLPPQQPVKAESQPASRAAAPEKPTRQSAPKAAPKDLNEANRRIMALSESDRRSLFFVALNTSGERCPEITRTFYQGSAKPSWNALWNVECRGGPSYVIQIMSDEKGSTKVLTCGELRAIGGGECFKRYSQ